MDIQLVGVYELGDGVHPASTDSTDLSTIYIYIHI
jgi:hypothetical protein